MEALYGDLENYNEVNIIEELRDENKDLKLKLEEYETAIGKLQKDYDKLVLEFNNLQTNYSSLLKTARAEVERKAQMITQLNLDKDMMVLKTLQNGNNRRFQNMSYKNTHNVIKKTNREGDNVIVGKKTKLEPKNSIVKNERCKSNISTDAPVSQSDSTKLLNIVDKVVAKVEEASITKSELKENVAESRKTCAGSIRDRRKSMPAFNVPHLSTDEDYESDKTSNPKHKDEIRPKGVCDKNNINERLKQLSYGIRSNVTPDTTSLSGKSSNCQEAPKDYRGEISRSFDYDKPRGDRTRESDRATEPNKTEDMNRYREGDNLRESYKYRKDNNIQDVGQVSREVDNYRDGNKYREVDKYRESHKFSESVRYRDSDKFRQDVRLREGEKFRENERHREDDKFSEHDKYGESKNRYSDKYRPGDKYRDSDRRDRESGKYRQDDKYRMVDKYRENDKYQEEDKYWHNEKFRSRDKFDPYRYKRHYSPDRPYKRNFREHQDILEYGRHRGLESPPPESHSVSHKRSHDKQILYDDHRYRSEKYQHRSEVAHAESPSLVDNHDEPYRKRQKIDYEIHDENRRHHNREPVIKPSCSMEYDILRASCQSPDAVFSPDSHTDTPTAHTIIEIKNTAATPLDDPRVTSKRYVLKTDNGVPSLSTASSKYIDIKPVDKSLWNIQSVAIPDALLHEPQSRLEEDSIKEIYTGISDPEANASIETGEILEDSFGLGVHQDKDPGECLKKNELSGITPDDSIQKTKPKIFENNTTNTGKMPIELPINNAETILVKDLPKIDCDDNLIKKILKENQTSAIPQSRQNVQHDNSIPENKNIFVCKNQRTEHNQISLSEMAMVRDDLELSDETSDNLDSHKPIAAEKELLRHAPSTIQKSKGNDLKSEKGSNFKITPQTNFEVVNFRTNKPMKEDEVPKKQKNKRRKTKSNEKEIVEKNNDSIATEKKVKSKKEKEHKPKEIKNKFTDLFGDSSSLITPEDLGIPAPPPCVALCEDAQDAVDINIKEISAPSSTANNITINEIKLDSNPNGTNTENKEIAVRTEEQLATSPVATSIIYQNLNSEVEINKSDTVKTVIISSGVQPQFILTREEATEERDANLDLNLQNNIDVNHFPVHMDLKKHITLKALATSTPHKEFHIHTTVEPDCANASDDSKNMSVDTIPQGSVDAPDVRIFVRRRRKGVKKT